MAFITNSATRMYIHSTGDVLIGSTNAANTLRYFDIQNADSGAAAGVIQRLVHRNAANTGLSSVDIVKYSQGGFNLANNDTGTSNFTMFSVGGTERMRIDAFGNVSIGGTSYGSKLTLYGGARFMATETAATTYTGVGSVVVDNVSISTSGSERLRVGAAGQFGIGGATYGTAGQFLTSGGPSAPPTWSSVNLSAYVLKDMGSSFPVGIVCYCILTGSNNIAAGGTTAGSNLRIERRSSDSTQQDTPAGTWRNASAGPVDADINSGYSGSGYFQRIA
jgi:hypothetical protein